MLITESRLQNRVTNYLPNRGPSLPVNINQYKILSHLRIVTMPNLPILPNESNATICLPDSSLPSFYMEDYTVLGLRVGNLDAAVRLLEKNGISIYKRPGYSELSIQQKDQIPQIIQLLNANDISCVIADIVEQVYQG
jgi:hypothetical protein